MSNVPLSESATAVAGADGTARVKLGPLRSFERWDVASTTVASTSTVLVPTAKVYRGSEMPSRLIDGTFTGTLDVSDIAYKLRSGEQVLVVFTGNDVGAQCTITLEGETVR